MGVEEQGWRSEETGRGCGEHLEFWSLPWDCGSVESSAWKDYAESRANRRRQEGRVWSSAWGRA